MPLLERQLRLLDYLKNKNQWIKGTELAQVLNVTDRTVRSDIITLKNTYGEDIIESIRTKGYKYNIATMEGHKTEGNGGNIDYIITPAERTIYLLKKLITSEKKINIYDLADELYVSDRTIESDIMSLKKILGKLDIDQISILRDGEELSISGESSKNILYYVASHLIPDIQCSDMQKYFPDNNIEYLGTMIIDILNNHNFISRYLSITKLIIDIALTMEANQNGFSYPNKVRLYDINIESNIEEDCYNISREIQNEIKRTFDIYLTNEEISFIEYLLYINKKMDMLENEIKNSDILEDDFYSFCYKEIIKLKEERAIDYTANEQLVKDLVMHIKVAMERVKLGISLQNPLADYIRNKYSYLLDVAIIISEKIEKEYNIKFDFNEISYIVAYLATMLHEEVSLKRNEDKLKILLYIPHGRANLILIQKQIEIMLKGKNITIDGVAQLDINNLNKYLSDYDLIITTSNRLNLESDNIVFIKETFTIIDKNNIKDVVDNILVEKDLYKFMKVCNDYLDPKLFIKNLNGMTKEDIINQLGEIFIDNGYVEKDYVKNVFIRENAISTEIDSGIAVPHSIKNDAIKNGIAIGILKNPIVWFEKKIKIVVMIAYGNGDMETYNYFIRFFADNVLDGVFVEDLRKCSDLQEIQKVLSKYFLLWIKANR